MNIIKDIQKHIEKRNKTKRYVRIIDKAVVQLKPFRQIGREEGCSGERIRQILKYFGYNPTELKKKRRPERPIIAKTCPNCDKEFETREKNKKYCTKECAYISKRLDKKMPMEDWSIERQRQYNHERYLNKKEWYKKWFKEYYPQNKERILAKSREYQKKNPERMKILHKRAAERWKERYRTDPEFRERELAKQRMYRRRRLQT